MTDPKTENKLAAAESLALEMGKVAVNTFTGVRSNSFMQPFHDAIVSNEYGFFKHALKANRFRFAGAMGGLAIASFLWNFFQAGKLTTDQKLEKIADDINDKLVQIDTDIKAMALTGSDYSQVKVFLAKVDAIKEAFKSVEKCELDSEQPGYFAEILRSELTAFFLAIKDLRKNDFYTGSVVHMYNAKETDSDESLIKSMNSNAVEFLLTASDYEQLFVSVQLSEMYQSIIYAMYFGKLLKEDLDDIEAQSDSQLSESAQRLRKVVYAVVGRGVIEGNIDETEYKPSESLMSVVEKKDRLVKDEEQVRRSMYKAFLYQLNDVDNKCRNKFETYARQHIKDKRLFKQMKSNSEGAMSVVTSLSSRFPAYEFVVSVTMPSRTMHLHGPRSSADNSSYNCHLRFLKEETKSGKRRVSVNAYHRADLYQVDSLLRTNKFGTERTVAKPNTLVLNKNDKSHWFERIRNDNVDDSHSSRLYYEYTDHRLGVGIDATANISEYRKTGKHGNNQDIHQHLWIHTGPGTEKINGKTVGGNINDSVHVAVSNGFLLESHLIKDWVSNSRKGSEYFGSPVAHIFPRYY
ncbi:hypothetical protein [Vibrio coralliilyticus]|uniref:hypothetical protein n=1 Tax=Vibrio coralliilyticus TaxID=190893 RepID=UPI000C172549|nr:hypothetical protein [Vibrio coralliilyticus]